MHIAILTFEGFNELDSLISFGILSRVRQPVDEPPERQDTVSPLT